MYTYIMCHIKNRLFYVGVTNNIKQRTFDHKNAIFETHTGKYNIKQLVWYEVHDNPTAAVRREKLIKKWNRAWKMRLIQEGNQDWLDLSGDWDLDIYKD